MDGTGYDEEEHAQNSGDGFSTEIKFEISAGKNDTGAQNDMSSSRPSGKIKGAAAFCARLALSIGVELLAAKMRGGRGDDNER